MTTIPQLPDAGALGGAELAAIDRKSTTITITATTISAQASDNSFNDSGSGFAFTVGDAVIVEGFTGTVANNLQYGVIETAAAGKITIRSPEGDAIVDEAAGDAVTISKWVSARAPISDIAALAATGSRNLLKVVAASTANVTLSTDLENADTLDGVTLATGDWVLVKDQTAGEENGVYEVAASGAPTRVDEADSSEELAGLAVYVMEGSSQADTLWTCTTDEPITVDTTSLTFAEFTSGGGSVAAQEGGSNVVAAATALNFDTDDFDITDEGSNVAGIALASDLVAGGYGGLELILSYDINGLLGTGNEIDVDVTGYVGLVIDLQNPAFSVSDKVFFRFSDDGGSTYYSGASDYKDYNFQVGTNTPKTGISAMQVTPSTTTGGTGFIYVVGTDSVGVTPSSHGFFGGASNFATRQYLDPSVGAGAINSVRFFSDAGNNATGGTLNIYGIRKQPVKSGAGFVERTYTEKVTATANSSTKLTMPDNCLWANVSGIVTGISGNILIYIQQADGSTRSTFTTSLAQMDSVATIATSNQVVLGFVMDANTGMMNLTVKDPSSADYETTIYGTFERAGEGGSRRQTSFADSAVKDVFIEITSTGTQDLELIYRYCVLEAEVGYKKELYTASATLTLADVPATVTIDTSGGAVALDLPASAPLGTPFKATLVDITNAATLVAASGERINGVTDGTFTFTGSAAYEQVILERVEYDTGLYEWVAIGDGSVA